MANQKKSGLATAGLVLGIIGIVLSLIPIINNFAFVLAILALVFGIVGMVKVKKGTAGGRGKAIAAIVLGVVTFVLVVASQVFYGSVLDKASDEVNKASSEYSESLDKATGDATEELLENDVTVELGSFEAAEGEFGIAETKLPVTVTNKNAEAKTYGIQIEAVNANGERIADETVFANDLGSGQAQKLEAFTLVTSDKLEAMKNATFEIVEVSQL